MSDEDKIPIDVGRGRRRRPGRRAWSRFEGYCPECKRIVPLILRETPTFSRPGIVGMVLVTHYRLAMSVYGQGMASTMCKGSGYLPTPVPEAADLPQGCDEPYGAV